MLGLVKDDRVTCPFGRELKMSRVNVQFFIYIVERAVALIFMKKCIGSLVQSDFPLRWSLVSEISSFVRALHYQADIQRQDRPSLHR